VESQFCSAGQVIGVVMLSGSSNWRRMRHCRKVNGKRYNPTVTIGAGSPSETCQKAMILKKEWIKSE
jgi:hypothetical protein